MKKGEITEKQREVYEFIRKKKSEDDIAPTVREICKNCGIKSTSTAYNYLKALIDKGYIEKQNNKTRAITISDTSATKKIPIVGTVAAGQPITAIEQIEGYINFEPQKNYDGALFALKVKGESMIKIGILDGDMVIAEQTDVVDNGKVAVVMVDGEDATVKRFYKEDGRYRLQPENDQMEPIYTDNASILGRVIAVFRYCE